MIHEQKDVFEMVRTLCRKTIALHSTYQDKEDCVRVYELDDIAYMARLLTAELGEISNENE